MLQVGQTSLVWSSIAKLAHKTNIKYLGRAWKLVKVSLDYTQTIRKTQLLSSSKKILIIDAMT